MITVDTQLHGYRQGHQLLDSTISLPKSDQSVVDRLSDIAGPLRPGELFDSYLSSYPLPSGNFYVLARTWQDLTVPRAGCVKTLSLIIPVDDWQNAEALQMFLELLNPQIVPSAATFTTLIESRKALLPQTPEFRASELLEALFLEDPKPVALFDAPSPELIAVRLLTALWPALRCRFALSTFALSPRKIEGRHFDLVFAPKDARSRFADWPGRRVDALAGNVARHRWTGTIVERVFQSPEPRLLADNDIRLIGEEESGTPAALRIALLWDELSAKLERSPTAALGLIDIANSKMHGRSPALQELKPALALAAQRAVVSLPVSEAWEFLGAMVRKVIGTPLTPALLAVTDSVGLLAGRSPACAIAFLDQAIWAEAIDAMVPSISEGLAAQFGVPTELALADALLPTFRRLVLASHQLARATLANPALVERMAEIMADLELPLFNALRDELLPGIVDDTQTVLAHSLFLSLGIADVLAQVERLNKVNRFQSKSLLPPLAERARQLGVIECLRDKLLLVTPSPGRDAFLRMTLLPTADDVWWLLRQEFLSRSLTNTLLHDIVGDADVRQFQNLLQDPSLASVLLERFEGTSDLLLRAVTEGELSLTLRVPIVLRLLPEIDASQRRDLAINLVTDCLRDHFGGDEQAALAALFAILELPLDGGGIVRTGLGRSLPESVVNRNLVVFNTLPKSARQCILGAIEELAEGLAVRSPLDLNENAATACAALLWDAQSVNLTGLLRGAGRLLPTLFRSGQSPVSPIVAATCPFIYRELAKEDDVPDIFKIVPFIDWDRCKAVRKELVDAFLSSGVWRPSDLALTACRAADVGRIFQRVAKSNDGEAYMRRIGEALTMLPASCRNQVRQAVEEMQPGKPLKKSRRNKNR